MSTESRLRESLALHRRSLFVAGEAGTGEIARRAVDWVPSSERESPASEGS